MKQKENIMIKNSIIRRNHTFEPEVREALLCCALWSANKGALNIMLGTQANTLTLEITGLAHDGVLTVIECRCPSGEAWQLLKRSADCSPEEAIVTEMTAANALVELFCEAPLMQLCWKGCGAVQEGK
jgi:hypothetical protein